MPQAQSKRAECQSLRFTETLRLWKLREKRAPSAETAGGPRGGPRLRLSQGLRSAQELPLRHTGLVPSHMLYHHA